VPNDYIQQLVQFTNLTKLWDSHNSVDPEARDYLHLSKLTNLRRLSLSLHESDLDEFLMAHLTDLTKLEALPFYLNGDSILKLAAHFMNQTGICISGNSITDAGARGLVVLTNLESLRLEKCSSITDSVVKGFSTLIKLREITIDSCSALTTDALTGFSKCTQLDNFQLSASPHIDSLSPLINCVNLSHIKLSRCYVETWGLAPLQCFTNLVQLDCSDFVQLKDNGLKYFNLPSLRVLRLRGDSNITDAGLKYLSELTDLQELELGICEKVTDAGLKHLDQLVGLTYLGMLSLVRITDKGAKHLTGLTRLKYLDFSACRVTDATVRLFANRKLYRLDIFNCPNITSEGIAMRDMITAYDYYFSYSF
jgi:F-box/leucine-rich repeat protein 14